MTISSIFERPHIFVVFFPGSSGNLISCLLDSLLNYSDTVNIATSGHAHDNAINERKKQGRDFLCMGSGIVSGTAFTSDEEKINYYREQILCSDYDGDKSYVTWSHDYTNIPLYNKLFPNAKILAINSSTVKERLIATLLKVNKNSFSNDNDLPATQEEVALMNRAKRGILALTIGKYYGVHCRQVPDELQQTDLLKYLMYRFYYDAFNFDKYQSLDATMPNISARVKFQPEHIRMVLADSAPFELRTVKNYHEISFNDILTNSKNIPFVVEQVLGRDLTSNDRDLIINTLDQYVLKQDPLILDDPMQYIDTYKLRADKIISEWRKA